MKVQSSKFKVKKLTGEGLARTPFFAGEKTGVGGFTLVETLVAVGILALAISGAFAAAQSGISSATYSKNQVTAFYLAQEGVEQIRNVRDENALNDLPWLSSIADFGSDPCYFGNICKVDILDSTPLTRCSGGSCPVLQRDPDTGFYGYDLGWEDTIFRREIELTSINEDEVSVLVTVYWSKGAINREFKVRENIFNWQ